MDRASLERVERALKNVAGALAERRRQEGQAGLPPFAFVDDCFDREDRRLRGEGQTQLADALVTLRTDIEAMDNG